MAKILKLRKKPLAIVLIPLIALLCSAIAIRQWSTNNSGEDKEAKTFAGEILEAKTPYVGDNSATANVLHTLGVSQYDDFKTEIKSDEKPFRLTVRFDTLEEAKSNQLSANTPKIGALALATIQNLDEIVFIDSTGKPISGGVITVEDANAEVPDQNIKDHVHSEQDIENLLTVLKYKRP